MRDKEIITTNSLVRYRMSKHSFKRLVNDYIRFECEYAKTFKSSFLCRIMTNFLRFIQDTDGDGFEKRFLNFINSRAKIEKHAEGRLRVTSALAKKVREFDFYETDTFKKNALLSYILEEYSSMPFSEREKIYSYDIYCSIKECIRNSKIIRMELKNKKLNEETSIENYIVKPYDIVLDDNSFSFYLVGYAKARDTEPYFRMRTFKLTRIISCSSNHKNYFLKKDDIYNIKDNLDTFGAAYIQETKNKNDIEVRLSKRGYELFLTTIVRQRPVPISTPEPDYKKEGYFILKFDCSYQQIRNYFFSFASNAEIVSPPELRRKFRNDYQKALELYK